MNRVQRLLTFALLLGGIGFWNSPCAWAADYSLFAGASNNFIFPGSLRVGINDWEVGMLHITSYGVAKKFKISDSYYSSFGGAATVQGEVSFGFWGAMGFNYNMFWGLKFRGEIFGVHAVNGFSMSAGILGISFDW